MPSVLSQQACEQICDLARQWSQSAIARATGLDHSTISKVIRQARRGERRLYGLRDVQVDWVQLLKN